jgi:hypothetical protein
MRYAVLRPFNTPSRRFAIGDVVWAEDIDGPVSVEDRAETGFMQPADPERPVAPLSMRRNQALPPPVELENDNAV